MNKHAAEKIASDYHNLGIQIALQQAGLIKTAGPIDKLVKAVKGGKGASKKKMLAAGGGAGLLGTLAALARKGGSTPGIMGPPNLAELGPVLGTKSVPQMDALNTITKQIQEALGTGGSLKQVQEVLGTGGGLAKAPYAPIGKDGLLGGMSYAKSPASEDLLTRIMNAPAGEAVSKALSKAAPAEGAGGYSLFGNMSGGAEEAISKALSKAAPAEGVAGPDILNMIRNQISGVTGVPSSVPLSPMPVTGENIMSQILSGAS